MLEEAKRKNEDLHSAKAEVGKEVIKLSMKRGANCGGGGLGLDCEVYRWNVPSPIRRGSLFLTVAMWLRYKYFRKLFNVALFRPALEMNSISDWQ